MRIAIFQDLHDRRLMSEEKCIESLTFSLLITKSHHFQKSDNIWALQSLFRIYTVSSEASFSWVDTSTLMVINWKLTFKYSSKSFSERSIARASRKIHSQVQMAAYSKWNIAVPFSSWPKSHGRTKQVLFLKVIFWQYSQR